jgi:hypothetical protein
LRTPSAWIAPQSGAFRQKLFKCVKAVIYSDDDEKEKQYNFLKKVCELLGGTIYKEINTTTRARYDEYYEQVKTGRVAYTGGEHRWMGDHFSSRPDQNADVNFGKLLRACLDAQAQIHLVGLDDIFADMDPTHPYHNDLNPQVVWPPPAAPIPIREVKFPSMAAAITAVKESYAAFVASTHKADWISNGKAWFKIFPVKYVVENNIARDQYVPDITHIAFGLCVDAVQRRALHVKFLPRRTEGSHIYGGGEERSFNGRPADAVFLGPPEFVSNSDVRTLLASENYTAINGDNNIYLRMNFRQSSSDLRYITVALYIQIGRAHV